MARSQQKSAGSGKPKKSRKHPHPSTTNDSSINDKAILVRMLSSSLRPIRDEILRCLGVREVEALTRTCKAFSTLWPTLRASAYNINRRLRWLFKDPVEFRSVQGICNALITGDAARHFFSRHADAFVSLTLNVSKEHRAFLVTYIEAEGYVPVRNEDKDDGELPLVQYKKHEAHDVSLLVTIDCDQDCALYNLLDWADTTASINLISWNKAFSLFPYSTFVKQEAYLTQTLSDDRAKIIAELHDYEGVKTKTLCWEKMDTPGYKTIRRHRRICDKYTWVMDLNTTGVEDPGIPDAVLESSTFQLRRWTVEADGYLGTDEPVPRYVVDCAQFLHPVLKYSYVVLVEGGDHDDLTPVSPLRQQCIELAARLNEATMIEMMKIPSTKRPPEYNQLIAGQVEANNLRGRFELPKNWTFYDKEIMEALASEWGAQMKLEEEAEKSKW